MTKYTITETAKRTGIPANRIKKLIFDGQIDDIDGCIAEETVNTILQEKQDYISLLEFALSHTTETFDGNNGRDRTKLRNVLEMNEFYGLEVLDWDDLVSGNSRDEVFFKRTDIPALEEKLTDFIGFCNIDEKQKIQILLQKTTGHKHTKEYIRCYMDQTFVEDTVIPSFTECVKIILQYPDVVELTNEIITKILNVEMNISTKDFIIAFLNYCRKRNPSIRYNEMVRNKPEKQSIPAYTDETYIAIARCVFGAKYISDHYMIENALKNHLYAEAWLYIAIHYVCGWRAEDICRGWRYLELSDKNDNAYGINKETLWEDILQDRLTEQTYVDACDYAIHTIGISGQIPSKTSQRDPSVLRVMITPELKPFFGLLTLIAEAVKLQTGDGYMKPNRAPSYQNKMLLKNFFGDEIIQILHNQNLQSRRLNKDYLQGVEAAARRNGCGGLLASAVASFARNHTNLDTITHYLQDHNLSGENAEMVLYLVMDRGVMGFEGYQVLSTAYPEVFEKLPMKQQNKLLMYMKEMSSYELETTQSGIVASMYIQDNFQKDDSEATIQMLKEMFEVSQNRGKAKDEGIYCSLRAKGMACAYPTYKSCLANGCRHLLFCKYGYIPLLQIIKEYKEKAVTDKKAEAVLKQVLIPRYQHILNMIMQEMHMNHQERNGMKKIMQEVLQRG